MDEFVQKVYAVLSTTPLRWMSLTATLPVDVLTRAPAPGEWSAVECLQHLLDTERMVFPVRVRAFLSGQDLVDFDADAQHHDTTAVSPALLAAQLAATRQESLALLATVRTTDLMRTTTHSELGPVTLQQMLNEWAAHDLMHTVQAERSIMQPFIAQCGPWREFFHDHDAAVDSPER